LRGGFPRSYLAGDDEASFLWRQDFIRTFLERDIPQLGFRIAASNMERFWGMIAHTSGQVLNRSKLGESLGVSHPVIQHYLDILVDCFMIRILKPFEANLKKRLIKSPKLLFRDTGILHALLGIATHQRLMSHPEYGPSWECFSIENILGAPGILNRWRPYFYRSATGEEIDLVLDNGMQRIAIECKSSSAPDAAKGFFTAIETIGASKAWIVAPVEKSWPVKTNVMAAGIQTVIKGIQELKE
jgi:predicted AAA+ superfamily ATPase